MADITVAQARLEGEVRDVWDGGGIVDMRFQARTAIDGWELEADFGGEIINIWNARIVSQDGTRYALGPLDYNARVEPGQSVELGVEVSGDVRFAPAAVRAEPVGGVETAEGPPPPIPSPAPPEEAQTPSIGPEPPDDAPAMAVPFGARLGPGAERLQTQSLRYVTPKSEEPAGLFVEGETVAEPAGTDDAWRKFSFAPGPFSVRGTEIVDAAGQRAEINGVNWFGFETEIFVAHGLWARNWREIMDEVRGLGFNTLRIPFSGELVATDGGTPSGIDFALNPDLKGLNGLEILDLVVGYADTIGLRVLLDYHRGNPGSGPNDNGLWFGEGRTEANVIAEWQAMADRYKGAPAVIGADLINEPHNATWGDGSASDWAAAAERIGNAVLSIAPDWLIVVEGTSDYDGATYWWGGNLQGVRDRPVELALPNRLVYSAHDYPASVFPQDWFFDGSDLVAKFRENWGFIVEDGIAPVLIGEWGSRLETPLDRAWADALSAYLRDLDIPWMWWSLNPNSGDTGGVLNDDWTTVREGVTLLLEPFLAQTRPPVASTEDAIEATFTVDLGAPAGDDLILKFATQNGTASAGEDFSPTAGTLVFSPGEQIKTVTVPILPDAQAEGDEFFYLTLNGASGASASAIAVIEDDDAALGGSLPFVDVASTVVSERANAAYFKVVLSEPARGEVEIAFKSFRLGAEPQDEVQGILIIPPSSREAVLEVLLEPETGPDGSQDYTLELQSARGAQLRTTRATATIAADPRAAAEISAAADGSDTRLTIDIVVEDDWGSGALFNVVLKNISASPVDGWQIALDLPFDLTELWSAVLVADEGSRITLRNADFNGKIAPGATVDFGFIADEGDIELQTLLTAADFELSVQ